MFGSICLRFGYCVRCSGERVPVVAALMYSPLVCMETSLSNIG